VRSDGELWQKSDWSNWRKRHFYAATEAVGLGRPRPYDLRHSFVSLRIREKELSLVDLAGQLGHSPHRDVEDLCARVCRVPTPASQERG
jgi:integrase